MENWLLELGVDTWWSRNFFSFTLFVSFRRCSKARNNKIHIFQTYLIRMMLIARLSGRLSNLIQLRVKRRRLIVFILISHNPLSILIIRKVKAELQSTNMERASGLKNHRKVRRVNLDLTLLKTWRVLRLILIAWRRVQGRNLKHQRNSHNLKRAQRKRRNQ